MLVRSNNKSCIVGLRCCFYFGGVYYVPAIQCWPIEVHAAEGIANCSVTREQHDCETRSKVQFLSNLLLPPAYVVRREGNVLTRVCLSVHRGGTHPIIFFFAARIRRMGKVMFSVCSHLGGVPISHNALQHFPECHGADTGGVPCQVQPEGGVPCRGGTLPGGGYPGQVPPPARSGQGGYPGRTAEGLLNTRRAVCLLRSRRRTFLCKDLFTPTVRYTGHVRGYCGRNKRTRPILRFKLLEPLRAVRTWRRQYILGFVSHISKFSPIYKMGLMATNEGVHT